MYTLTRDGSIHSGAYATLDTQGVIVVQFFVDRDDAERYNIHLEAIGQELVVTETPDDNIDKLCNLMGYAYTIVEPGDLVVPRVETLENLQ